MQLDNSETINLLKYINISSCVIPSRRNSCWKIKPCLLSFLDVEIKREGEKIHRVFQDPTGQHLLVCMESKECFYIGSRLPKRSQPKQLTKVKGQLIESVAWNKVEQNDQSTGAILLGTSTGECVCM